MSELVPIAFDIPGEIARPRSRGRGPSNTSVPIDKERPEWLKVRLPVGPQVEELRRRAGLPQREVTRVLQESARSLLLA